LNIPRFAVVNVVLVVVWLGLAWRVLRRHDALLEQPARADRPVQVTNATLTAIQASHVG
jgi:hypothetical protein